MRNITPEMASEFSGSAVEPVLMIEMIFDSGDLRFWSGYGNLTWGDKVFTGAGGLIGVSPVEETQETQARGLVATLNGISSTIIAIALNEKARGRPFRMWLGSVSISRFLATEEEPGRIMLEDGSGYIKVENDLVDSPYRIFSGLMDYMEITDNGDTADIRLQVENILIAAQKPKIGRYTSEDQRRRFPNDKGLDFINQLQDKELVW